MKKVRPAPGRWRRVRRAYVLSVVVVRAERKSPPAAPLILVVIDLVSWPDRLIEAACRNAGWAVSDQTADLLLKALILVVCALTAGRIRRWRRGRAQRFPDRGAGSAPASDGL
jgi:hypothetical protein